MIGTNRAPALGHFGPTWLAAGGIALLGLGLGASVADVDGPPLCPYRRCTGGWCPGCGMSRALGQLIRGNWKGAVALHPLAPLIAVELGVIALALLAFASGRLRLPSPNLWAGAIAANTLLLLAVWVLRIADGTLPTG